MFVLKSSQHDEGFGVHQCRFERLGWIGRDTTKQHNLARNAVSAKVDIHLVFSMLWILKLCTQTGIVSTILTI